MIIFHAGTTRTVFLGCLKVTTIFLFTFFSVVVAPTHFYAADQPAWIAPAGQFFEEILENWRLL